MKDGITGIETGKTFSQYVQDIIIYLLGFLTLIVVILIMWAGFSILTAAGDEEKVKSGKKIIFRAIIGLLIIFFAWSITTFIIGNGSATPNTSLIKPVTFLEKWGNPFVIDTTFAATNDSRGFDYYRSSILKIMQDMDQEQEVDGKLSTKNINLLRGVLEQSKDTFSDSTMDFNTSLTNNVLNQLALIQKYPDSDVYIERLGNALKDFLTKIKVGSITAKITATPTS